IVLSVVVSFISSAVGFYVSWILNLPTGAVIVLVQFFIYLLSLILKPMLR
ncbi:MAG: metal ABC transporter permease, partial [Candidatus Cloacimonetes bacterium]|nr:metal ABC transporter permease [Candidatus Cloacimonadota bacterium]